MSESDPGIANRPSASAAGLAEAEGWTDGLRKAGRSLYASKPAFVGVIFLLVLAFLAIFAEWIVPHDIRQPDLMNRLAPPSWSPDGVPQYLLGTDGQGRDLFSRLIHAGRVSLSVAVASVFVGGGIGVLLGLIAGYVGGRTESIIMRLGDLQLAFPSLFLGLVVMGLLGAGVVELILVIALAQWAYYARVTRGEVLRVKQLEFIDGARVVGASHLRIIVFYVIPNVLSSIIVVATFSLAVAIYYESALSFFGLGVPPDIPTWGNMLSQARNHMLGSPWYPVFPGLAITFTVLAFNLAGDWLRDYLDVKIAN